MNIFIYNKINGEKEQFKTTLSIIQGDAIRHEVEAHVFTLAEFQSIQGNAGVIPNPIVAPIQPALNANKNVWKVYEMEDRKYNKRNDVAKAIRAAVINILRDQDLAAIQHQ